MAKSKKQTATTEVENLEVISLEQLPIPLENNVPAQLTIHDSQNVLNSKRYVKGSITMASPSELFAPVMELFHNIECELTVSGSGKTEVAELNGDLNTAFDRTFLIAKFTIDEDLSYQIGILAAYDLSVSKIKIFRGAIVHACLNLSVFGKDDVVKFDFSNGIDLKLIRYYLDNVTEKISEVKNIVSQMKAKLIPRENLAKIIGNMIIETKQNKLQNGTNSISKGLDLLLDDKSKYYAGKPDFNSWDLYNAFTEFNSKSDLFDIPEKARDTFHLVSKYAH